MAEAKRTGVEALQNLTNRAIHRLLAHPPSRRAALRGLFTDEERKALAESLAAVTATADLLGRSRVRERQEAVGSAAKPRSFAEEPTTWLKFDETAPPEPMPPEKALAYFRSLFPALGPDPRRFAATMRRQAFTLAVATERTLLDRVRRILAGGLEGDTSRGGLTRQVQEVLDRAGVTPANPDYASMVVRTNLMDAYNQGQTDELQDPDVKLVFPAWRYDGIKDGRQGRDHEIHFGKYYPVDVPFAVVRGNRPYNCRCAQTPVSAVEWDRLVAAGVWFSSDYPGAVDLPPPANLGVAKKRRQPRPAAQPVAVPAPAPLPADRELTAAPLRGLGNTTGNEELRVARVGGQDYVLKQLQREAPAEVEVSTLAREVGLGTPEVRHVGEGAAARLNDEANAGGSGKWVVMPRVEGRPLNAGADAEEQAAVVAKLTPAQKRVLADDAAFSYAVGNTDRNDANYLVREDGKIVPIDYEPSFTAAVSADDVIGGSPLASLPEAETNRLPVSKAVLGEIVKREERILDMARRFPADGVAALPGEDVEGAARKRMAVLRELAAKEKPTLGDLRALAQEAAKRSKPLA